ncbi:MAG TPA: glycosyltransferase family 2 protein [Firmicutes bacterium]|uniref:Glycosyltransferase family 2 protein n=2 Tax=Capillibacterium thermochitinicola TaxID=2699427 RepID=A0A8J6HYJ2_9FIRM|nr:glycosyltransferase family 2 protein [Capillibacterium thermochitinicola]MBA2132385.1 glycosyltransferase family 2 protein [Capillibacterium thermochitinicola]HHW12144.1 glycosyltransferase family 2 protein [Bacillota bacterium]
MKETVDLIVVNFNTKKLLAACLDSLRRFSGAPDTYRLWVVDNASTDGSVTLIRSLPWVTGIFNRENRGYATACNQGIKAGNAPYIFILNSDTLVTEGWLPPLIAALQDPAVAVVGPRLVSPDGYLVGAGVVGTETAPIIRGWGVPDDPALFAEPTACLSICGACLGLKRALLPELGYFDENYFHYFEETDYCYNARRHGYKVLYVPTSRVIHLVNGSCRNRRRLAAYFRQSKAYFDRKWQIGEGDHEQPAKTAVLGDDGRPE